MSENMAVAASENYQLKWHSYGAHLHSSVATLLHSESFADVLLATSCGRHVAAHRFVLAACSSYLSHIFQTCHFGANTNAPIIVVLPTEIGYRTLKILIQYMYSGEATVTNDQLEGVLKAGDILRVRGLWRSNNGSKKENIQSNSQKVERDKKEAAPLAGQIQKIKLVQPMPEKIIENVQQPVITQSTVPTPKSSDGKLVEKNDENVKDPESTKVHEGKKNEDESKTNGNPEANAKKRKSVNSETESNRTRSEAGDNDELNLELLVKDEPIDWEETIDPSETLTIDHEMDIKPEIVHSADEEGEMEEEEYTPLTCDMCSQTFNRPSDWVRHIEFTHADMTENRRRKRKGDTDDDSKDFPPLKCDLCGNMYPTPQEWVRHIQTEHTEEQLALMNNSAPPKPKRVHSHQKLCNICQKVFPSHASMVIHQRTHTGEKPFLCSYCKKGFNVKSNLLRHLRTLHDKFVHPSLYGSNGNKNT
ncbi:zinc finger protein 37 homolog [Neodiprion virginianus]|uniref:Zinc finger protein 37 homolog n=1 Tax=Neodiprion lecontei TaxID=441921 RepID=A0ABM3FCZ5_NEOLC|nr:zinc finger protein 37 homolog [Neodiprion fabricii]XP_046585878.1 zinc finger protein 37 homolog [Neodiprion lecontei]XP_046617375.1 zinc finger protein 37 homolog [Neodiprion virginianus]